MSEVNEVIEYIEELKEDNTVPKNIRAKMEEIVNMLNSDEEISIKVSKIQNELEDMANDANIQPFTRTQIYNLIGMIESLA